jgi:hypothetical protein
MGKLNKAGFSAVEGLLIVVIVAILGGTGFYVYNAQKNTDKTLKADTSTTPTFKKKATPQPTTGFVLPSDWKWYQNAAQKVAVAYPKSWDTNLGFKANLGVVNESAAKLYQGCGEDPSCEVKYDTTTGQWSGANLYAPIGAAKISSNAEAYLIPIKGDTYCGAYGLYIHYDKKFVHSILSLCEKNDDPDFQLKDGVLSYEATVQDLEQVLKSLTTIQ